MAYYKVFDRAKFRQFPVFALWFRRYAPFDDFGGVAGVRFEGDHRDAPSTSPKATSRTYGCVFFNRYEVLYGFSGSSGTHIAGYAPWTWIMPWVRITGEVINRDVREAVAFANVSLEVKERNRPDVIEFTASTAGANPMVPKSPDIDTIVNASFNFSKPKFLIVNGEAFGDDFPNLEVFLDSGSNHTALLLDGRTTGGRDTGPMTRLAGSHSDQSLGRFSGTLTINDKGQLTSDYKVAATEM